MIGRGGDIPAGDLAGVMQQAQPFALAEVQLGVRPRPGGLEAHAWVVWQGAVLNDTPDVAQRYAVLDQLNEQIHLPHTN